MPARDHPDKRLPPFGKGSADKVDGLQGDPH